MTNFDKRNSATFQKHHSTNAPFLLCGPVMSHQAHSITYSQSFTLVLSCINKHRLSSCWCFRLVVQFYLSNKPRVAYIKAEFVDVGSLRRSLRAPETHAATWSRSDVHFLEEDYAKCRLCLHASWLCGQRVGTQSQRGVSAFPSKVRPPLL